MSLLAASAAKGRTTEDKKRGISRINTAVMILSSCTTAVNVAVTGLTSSSKNTIAQCMQLTLLEDRQ